MLIMCSRWSLGRQPAARLVARVFCVSNQKEITVKMGRLVQLQKYIEVQLPDELDLSAEINPEYCDTYPVITSWKGDEVFFGVSADDQPGNYQHHDYWQSMYDYIKSVSDSGELETLDEGEYETEYASPMSYKTYAFVQGGIETIYNLHLISSEKIAYWIICTCEFKSDIAEIHYQLRKILSTARITYSN
jgi:hypothetical protein